MLAELMKMQDGGKFKPKEMHVEVMAAKPMDEEMEESEEHEAMESPEEEMEEHEEGCDDEFEGDDAKKMSLKDFLASRSKK